MTNEERILDDLAAAVDGYSIDAQGICRNFGKFEGCFEACLYFYSRGMENDYGLGLLSFDDGSNMSAYRVTSLERELIRGPWNLARVFGDEDLYVVSEGPDGSIIGSYMTPKLWSELVEEYAGADDAEFEPGKAWTAPYVADPYERD